jgi:hypothetical protein
VLVLSASFAAAQTQAPAKSPTKPAAANASKEESPRRKAVVPNRSGFELADPAKLKHAPMHVAATRGGEGSPVPLAPQLGKVFTLQPVFHWSGTAGAGKFVFVLYDASGAEVFLADASRPSYAYPAQAPAVSPGKRYSWVVLVPASATSPGKQSDAAGFVVVGESERAEIEKGLASIHGTTYAAALARAKFLAERRLWYDCVAAFSELIARYPERAELYEQRGNIYAQVEATQALAEQDLARARRVPHKKGP